MFCININSDSASELTKIYREMEELTQQMRRLLPASCQKEQGPLNHNAAVNENFTNSLSDRLDQAIVQCLPDPAIPLLRLTYSEKMRIVGKLNDMGFFQIKGAVSETAKHLSCSEATIYRYLSKIGKKQEVPHG